MTVTDRLTGFDAGAAIKSACRVASTANITLSSTQVVDGVAILSGDRVLVLGQTTGADNGIYVVAASTWTRAQDFDGARDALKGTIVFVNEGTNNAATLWRVTSTGTNTDGSLNIGTDNSSFTKIVTATGGISAYGATLVASSDAAFARSILGSGTLGDSFFISTTTAAAKTILGLGTAASTDTGSSGHVLIYADGRNIFTAGQLSVPATLTLSGGNITPDLSTSNNFTFSATANATLQVPTNVRAGAWFSVSYLQGSSTNFTLSYSSAYRFGGGSTGSTAPAVGTIVNSRSEITCKILSSATGAEFIMTSLNNMGV